MRTIGGRWSVIGDGGHLWLVMHHGRVEWIYHHWNDAMYRANLEARRVL